MLRGLLQIYCKSAANVLHIYQIGCKSSPEKILPKNLFIANVANLLHLLQNWLHFLNAPPNSSYPVDLGSNSFKKSKIPKYLTFSPMPKNNILLICFNKAKMNFATEVMIDLLPFKKDHVKLIN